MFKKSVFLFISVPLVLGFSGCKGKNERSGDSYYKEGKFRNAVNSYTAAMQKGKISDEFYDSFVIAYASAAKQTAQKNSGDDIIRSYVEQIHKYLPNAKKASTLDSVALALSEVGITQVKGGFEYEYVLQGFRNLDSAISIAQRGSADANAAKAARQEAEKAVVKQAIENSDGAENTIAAEYVLLEAEVVAPNNADLKKALNNIRLKNRGDYLLFAEEIIGQRASRLVDKYGYVISFPILSITKTGASGEIAVWNATGNNVDFDLNKLKMISTDGKEVYAKYTGGGWCFMSDHLGKKKSPFKGSTGKLLSELSCQAKLSFSYSNNFVPDYVEYKDSNNNTGRKYFGQR